MRSVGLQLTVRWANSHKSHMILSQGRGFESHRGHLFFSFVFFFTQFHCGFLYSVGFLVSAYGMVYVGRIDLEKG